MKPAQIKRVHAVGLKPGGSERGRRQSFRGSRGLCLQRRYIIPGLDGRPNSLDPATRSNAITDVGLGKALPACRLKYTRHRRPQERFRTGPSDLDLGNVEQIRIAACRKKRAVEITLNRLCPAIAEHMNPLRERLLDVFARGMIELAQPCMPGFDLNHSTASTCSLALKHRDQHSRRTHFHAATVVLLK